MRATLGLSLVFAVAEGLEAQPAARLTAQSVSKLAEIAEPAIALAELRGTCFTFILTPQIRSDLLSVAGRSHPRVPLSEWAPVLQYIAQHPCELQKAPSANPPLPQRTGHSGFYGVSADAFLNESLRGLGAHFGTRLTDDFDLLAAVRFATTDNARLSIDTATLRMGTASLSGRLWLLQPDRGPTAYLQGGGVAQIEAYEAYQNRGNYFGLGVSGGGGIGMMVTGRNLLFLEIEGQTIWLVTKDESLRVPWEHPYTSHGSYALRLGFSRFWERRK